MVVSSHLYWDPKFDYVKYAQTSYLLKRLSQFKLAHNLPESHPIIVCGDFNSLPDSSCLSLIYNQKEFRHNKHFTVGKSEIYYDQIWNTYNEDS